MNIHELSDNLKYIHLSHAEAGDWEFDSMSIVYFHSGPCIIATQLNSGNTTKIFAPSKGAGYVANKKLGRRYKRSGSNFLFPWIKLPVVVGAVSPEEVKSFFVK